MTKFKSIFLIICIPILAMGQNSTSDYQTDKDSWSFDVTPYLWFSSIQGNISFLNQSVPVESEFKDILDQLSFGALVHAEAKKGRWAILTDLVYLKLKEEGTTTNSTTLTELEIEQTILELSGAYTILKVEDYLTIDGLFGLRYFALNPSLAQNKQIMLDESLNFTNPIIGARFKSINGKWINSARVDIGLASEVTWKLNLLVGYQFSELFSLYAGYQGYDVNYKGDDSFVYDVYTGGFLTGFNFHF